MAVRRPPFAESFSRLYELKAAYEDDIRDGPVLSSRRGADIARVLLIAAGTVEIVRVHDQALAALHPRLADGGDNARALGIGGAGAFVVGVVILSEPLTIGRVLVAALIVAGRSLMKLSTSV